VAPPRAALRVTNFDHVVPFARNGAKRAGHRAKSNTLQHTMALAPTPARDRPKRHPALRLALVLAAITAAVALLGLPAGFAWVAIAPRVSVVVTGHGVAQVVNPETKAFIAADGWFCVVGVIGGLLAGVAGYLIAVRRRGPAAVAGLILGGLAASLVQWWIGAGIGRASFRRALYVSHRDAVLHAPLMLRAHGALVVWPLTAALVAGLAELLAGQPRDTQALMPPGGERDRSGAAPKLGG